MTHPKTTTDYNTKRGKANGRVVYRRENYIVKRILPEVHMLNLNNLEYCCLKQSIFSSETYTKSNVPFLQLASAVILFVLCYIFSTLALPIASSPLHV